MALREIIFRGKRLGNGEWVYGNYAFADCFTKHQHYIFQNKAFEHAVDPSTICQFTGLLDENGKRIFENDTVRFKRKFAHGGAVVRSGRIVCDERNARFHISDSDGYICWDIYEVEDIEVEDIEVVHDNPELLEVTPDE